MTDRPKLNKRIKIASGELSDDQIRALNKRFPQTVAKARPIAGPQGERGPQGIRGLDGSDGIDGVDGKRGPRGEAGTQGPPGEDGDDGLNVFQGVGAPADDFGLDGESYIDSKAFALYLKAEGKWTKTGTFKGLKGERGVQGPPGPGGPRGRAGSGVVAIGGAANNILFGNGPPIDDEIPTGQNILVGSGPPSND